MGNNVWLHSSAAQIWSSSRHSFPACSLRARPRKSRNDIPIQLIDTGRCSLLIGLRIHVRSWSSSGNPSTECYFHVISFADGVRINSTQDVLASCLASARSVRLFFAIIEESTELDFGAPELPWFAYRIRMRHQPFDLSIYVYISFFGFHSRNKMSQEFGTKPTEKRTRDALIFLFHIFVNSATHLN